MTIKKFADGAAFVAIDLEGAERAVGIVRQARKILQGGTLDLARSLTYTFASLELRHSGASAGISAEGDDRDPTVAAFATDIMPLVTSQEFLPNPGKGVPAADLRSLAEADPRSPIRELDRDGLSFSDELAALTTVAAADRALDGLDGRRVAIEGFEVNGPALLRELSARGAVVTTVHTSAGLTVDAGGLDPTSVSDAWAEHGPGLVAHVGSPDEGSVFGADADLLIPSSKMGCLTHTAAIDVQAAVVAPGAPLPITARGLAVLRAADKIALPDFVAQAGPVWAWEASADASADDVRAAAAAGVDAVLDEILPHDDGPFLAACYRAEAFLRTWQDDLPFGRPLAS